MFLTSSHTHGVTVWLYFALVLVKMLLKLSLTSELQRKTDILSAGRHNAPLPLRCRLPKWRTCRRITRSNRVKTTRSHRCRLLLKTLTHLRDDRHSANHLPSLSQWRSTHCVHTHVHAHVHLRQKHNVQSRMKAGKVTNVPNSITV